MLLLLDLFFLIMQIKETKVLLRCEDRVQRMAIRDVFLQLADRAFFSVVVVRIIIWVVVMVMVLTKPIQFVHFKFYSLFLLLKLF